MVLNIPLTNPETVLQIPSPLCNTPLITELIPSHKAFAPVFSKLQTLPKRSAFIADNADMRLDNGLVTKWTRLPNPVLIVSKQLLPNCLMFSHCSVR